MGESTRTTYEGSSLSMRENKMSHQLRIYYAWIRALKITYIIYLIRVSVFYFNQKELRESSLDFLFSIFSFVS